MNAPLALTRGFGVALLAAALSAAGCGGRGASSPPDCRDDVGDDLAVAGHTGVEGAKTGGKTAVEGIKTFGSAAGGLVTGGKEEAKSRWNEGKGETKRTANQGAADTKAQRRPRCR